MVPNRRLNLSGERLRVVYRVHGEPGDVAGALARVEALAVEQTLEFPVDVLDAGDIRDELTGRVEAFAERDDGVWEAVVSYAAEAAGFLLQGADRDGAARQPGEGLEGGGSKGPRAVDFPQTLNVIFGNTSLQPGIRVERIDVPPRLVAAFRGPRFGVAGLRRLLGVAERPLLCTALKPMGLSAEQLADMAYRFALGGIDVIKDDHGLADQSLAPYRERVARCAEAVRRANEQSGCRSIYVPNVTGPADEMMERAHLARREGAGGLMVAPGLTGFDAMRQLADDDAIALPIVSHPAFLGGWLTSPVSGMSHFALLGQLMRLAGADASIFPNEGGRFAFTARDCQAIAEGCRVPMGHLKPIFPTPGGGMTVERAPAIAAAYGRDVMLLIGGDLFRGGDDLVASARRFVESLEAQSAPAGGPA